MIKLRKQNVSETLYLTIPELEQEMGIEWVSSLVFEKPAYRKKSEKVALRAMKKQELNVRERWLGARYSREIANGAYPDLSIRFIDPVLGYGVFAEKTLAKGTFIGEYTGEIRKRNKRKDRKNSYCFEYTIGDWIYNPFIIDAEKKGNITRFMNHNDDPNVESLSVFAGGLMHIVFLAEKEIEVGSQLCYHYGDTFWKKRRQAKKLDFNP